MRRHRLFTPAAFPALAEIGLKRYFAFRERLAEGTQRHSSRNSRNWNDFLLSDGMLCVATADHGYTKQGTLAVPRTSIDLAPRFSRDPRISAISIARLVARDG